jgi:hypothetical protein
MRKPYIIATPQFEISSGGIRVMWGLYGWLLSKGEEVYVNCRLENRESIAIYPEIFHGNPAEGTTIVRYILNKPGVMGSYGVPGPTQFDPNDKLYYFSRIFAPDDNCKILFLPICNLNLFKDQKKNRTKTCYLVGKGQNTFKHPQDAILIDRRFSNDQQALADVLNECHTFYSYDSVTAMFEIARLCGCKVVRFDTSVDLSKYEPGLNGIDSELDTNKFREHYIEMVKLFDKEIDNFICQTQ